MASVLWHSDALRSTEFFTLREADGGYALAGTVLVQLNSEPAKIEYLLFCDPEWRTREVGIYQVCRGEGRTVQIKAEGDGLWSANGNFLKDVQGLLDVDLAITPSTNLLPLKRTPVAVGESFETAAVWVQFPSLEISPLPQKYTRLSETEYDYEAPTLDFRAHLTFDSDGVCKTYGELWRRF